MRIGIVSDTHGLLRPRVAELLAGSERILHAGDVGDAAILDRLSELAPVTAVRGNVDLEGSLAELPAVAGGELGGLAFRMVHQRDDVPDAWLREARLVVHGHSHRPELAWHGRCLVLNPGACGPRRFHLPLTLALVEIADGRVLPEIRRVE